MSEATSSAEQGAQALCQACGLCCRGVWFSHVSLAPDEVDNARRVGLTVHQSEERIDFYQPCVMHQNDGCSIYHDWRPTVCVKYSCALRDAFLTGETGFDRALSHVTAARAMADRIQADTGPLEGGLRGKAFLSLLSGKVPTAGAAALTPGSRLDAVALRVYFDKYFKKPETDEKEGSVGPLPTSNE